MKVYVDDGSDALWWELWKCSSVDELRLKCAVYGVDMERWLRCEGMLWSPRYEDGWPPEA